MLPLGTKIWVAVPKGDSLIPQMSALRESNELTMFCAAVENGYTCFRPSAAVLGRLPVHAMHRQFGVELLYM